MKFGSGGVVGFFVSFFVAFFLWEGFLDDDGR